MDALSALKSKNFPHQRRGRTRERLQDSEDATILGVLSKCSDTEMALNESYRSPASTQARPGKGKVFLSIEELSSVSD